MFFVYIGLIAATYLISRYMRPDAQAESNKRNITQGDVTFPRATEGTPVPIAYGRVKIKGGNVVWMGALETFGSPDTTFTSPYSIPFQMIFALPGGDFGTLQLVWIDDKVPANGGTPKYANQNTDYFFYTNPPTGLPSGSPDPDKGITMIWEGGDVASNGITYSTSFFDKVFDGQGDVFGEVDYDKTLLPRYKGYMSGTFYSGVGYSLTPMNRTLFGWPLTASAGLQTIAVEVIAQWKTDPLTGAGPSEFPGLTLVGNGDMNPAHVIYDILTRQWARLGLSVAVDTTSFAAAAATLKTEGHGFSMVWYNSADAREMLREVLTEIGGVLYEDTIGGVRKYVLKLIRADYNPLTIPVFDETNILDGSKGQPSFSQTTWAETFNEVRVTYNDRDQGYTDRVASAQDLANYTIQGKKRTVELRYPGISNAPLAAAVAARELKAVCRPLVKVRLPVNRDGWSLRPGDPFTLNWSELGISGLVLRVSKIDPGALEDQHVTIDAIEDAFTVASAVFGSGGTTTTPPAVGAPTPITERIFDEAPRWFLLQAQSEGRITNADVSHAWFLPVPSSANDVYHEGQVSSDGTNFVTDSGANVYRARGSLHTTYARVNDPYDTTVGLVVDGVTGITPQSIVSFPPLFTNDGIKTFGANLLRIGDEILAFETAADNGGGQWALTNVWRGLLDTVPADHPAGARVTFLSDSSAGGVFTFTAVDTNQIGVHGLNTLLTITGRDVPTDTNKVLLAPQSDQPTDTLVVRGRTLLPYPVADLKLDASKTPAAKEEAGTALTCKTRDRLKTTITRGDVANETPEAGTSWSIRAQKLRAQPDLADSAAVDIITGETVVANISSGYSNLSFAKAGHGTLSIQVRSINNSGNGWQDAALPIVAYHWRNLLLDPRWDLNNGSWVVDQNAISYHATGGLGNGAYVNALNSGSDLIVHQTVACDGYNAVGLVALFTFYGKGNSGDQLKPKLYALDSGGGTLGTVTATVAPDATWNYYELAYTNLPAGTVSIKVEQTSHPLGGSPSVAGFTEAALRIVQSNTTFGNYYRLQNPGFETASTANWTVASGTFSAQTTAPLYERGNYVQCDTSGTLQQDFTLPAGYEFSSTVLEVGRMTQTGTGSDTGEVKLLALDGSNATLASVTTGAESLTAQQTWYRRRLHLDCPDGVVTVRVQFLGVHTAGQGKACADAFRLYVFKQLDPSAAYVAHFDTPPTQALPRSGDEWFVQAGAIVTQPDVLIHDFASSTAPIGGAFSGGTHVFTAGKFTGLRLPITGGSPTCLDLGFASQANAETLRAVDPKLAAFNAATPFTMLVVYKADGDDRYTTTHELAGRVVPGVSGKGYFIDLDASGHARANYVGATSAVSATGTVDTKHGGPAWAALVYNGSNTLHLIDAGGDHTVSTAGTGAIDDATATFAIGAVTGVGTGLRGQVARCYVWSTARTAAELQSLMAAGFGADPSGKIATVTRSGTWLLRRGTDADGELLVRAPAGETHVAYDAQLASDGGTGWGLPAQASLSNLAPSQDQSNGGGVNYWGVGGGAAAVTEVRGPEGYTNATQLTNVNHSTDYLELQLIPVGAGNVTVIFWYRAPDANNHNAQVTLLNASSVQKDTFSFATGTVNVWTRVVHTFTGWDASSATCKLRFWPRDSNAAGVVQIAASIFVGQGGRIPVAVPDANASASGYYTCNPTLTTQPNSEGELIAECVAPESGAAQGTLLNLRNVTNSNDRRRLYQGASGNLKLDHYDGAAASNTASTATADWTLLQTSRGRWCRASLFDGAAIFSQVRNGGGSATGRASAWTPGTVASARLDVGHNNGSDPFTGLIRKISLTSREAKL